MKPVLYILQSTVNGRYYIGSTTDIERRLKQHNSGHTHTTKRLQDFKVVFVQEYPTLAEVRHIEKKIKSWKRRDFVEKIIRDGKISSS